MQIVHLKSYIQYCEHIVNWPEELNRAFSSRNPADRNEGQEADAPLTFENAKELGVGVVADYSGRYTSVKFPLEMNQAWKTVE